MKLFFNSCFVQYFFQWTELSKGRLEQIYTHKNTQPQPIHAYQMSQCNTDQNQNACNGTNNSFFHFFIFIINR